MTEVVNASKVKSISKSKERMYDVESGAAGQADHQTNAKLLGIPNSEGRCSIHDESQSPHTRAGN